MSYEEQGDHHKHFIGDIPQKAIIIHEGRVLIVQDDKGMWQLPGGRLHEGETPIEGLQREIREELSVEVKVVSIFDTFVFVSVSGARHFLVIYSCELLGDIKDIQKQEDEIKGLRWIYADEIESFTMWTEYKEVIRKYFEKSKLIAENAPRW
ncbi:MAG: NUDIX hydrolase [Candidatus Sungbacteria bacterium]|nr:NUDIX hydrolase [Candidatus Sungbacteria bacterium]